MKLRARCWHRQCGIVASRLQDMASDPRKRLRNAFFLHLIAVCIVLHISNVASKKIEETACGTSMIVLNRIDNTFDVLNRAIAELEWQTLANRSITSSEIYMHLVRLKLKLRNGWCTNVLDLENDGVSVNENVLRFLCKGPKYTNEIARKITVINQLLSSAYTSARICKIENYVQRCYNGELDVGKLMATSRNETELRWAWTAWRNHMSHTKKLFGQLVNLQNTAVRNNGYADIGEYWREEYERPDLENVFEEMYRQVEPLYSLLHAVVRFRLARLYPDVIDVFSPIPAHLLGNLWSQSWEALIDVVFPTYTAVMPNLTDSMIQETYSVIKMVKTAEDFYTSLGFPPLPSEFWKKSIFEQETGRESSCHATAVNMYKKDDFRIFACLETRPQDFNVIYHEIGHIQYYMAYQNQPSFFKNGINSAFHESIGDAISYGATSFRHMHRLELIRNASASFGNSSEVNSRLQDSLEIALLLKQALLKIPQLSNGLIIEKWRWSVFSGKTQPSEYNTFWWNLHRRYMGVVPPSPRSEKFFDPAAKFHIAHGIPYAGYFLGNFLQIQLFQGMCEASLNLPVGSTAFNLPLHKCDIYGSKDAGKFLRSIMKLGSKANWRHALRVTTGYSEYRIEPFLAYYEPVREWLQREIEHHGIPVGWD
ncbi:angiotensin-converting enzyme-like isoform X1 [Temnothorax curvispinosus]|uniref:Angiotensin-converting enzyme n=2 Tax=Temnothorax curvispinosus TaxID=300111 RepID=A0A6J1PYZ4_9HYME|nr:angiotensin-converting enzyme-like isoform X1 [Temnothorax curvispinosus]